MECTSMANMFVPKTNAEPANSTTTWMLRAALAKTALFARFKRLKKQIAELEKANEILRAASVFFATELGRPSSR